MSDDSNRPFQPPAFGPPAGATGSSSSSGGPLGPRPSGSFEPPTYPAPSTSSPIVVEGERPSRGPGRRSKGMVFGAGLAAVALVGAGVFAATKIGDDSTKGGAATAEDVGRQLTGALDHEDILGVVDLLLPGERDTFRQPLLDGVGELKRINVLSDSADPSDVDGLDIRFDDVQVTAAQRVADDIENVRITGRASASYNGADLPIGDLLLDNVFSGEQPSQTGQVSGAAVDWQVTTVERDGRWYLSLFYSIAEQARMQKVDQPDVPAEGVELRGEDSPEAAVDGMAQAVTDLDVKSIIGRLNPHEAEALQRYAPLFVDRATNEVEDNGARISISDTSYTVTGSGSHRSVGIDGFTASGGARGDSGTVVYHDGCFTFTAEGEDPVDSCDSGGLDEALDKLNLDDQPEVRRWIDTIRAAFADFTPTGIAVDQVDGKWYVSPIGTSADFLLAVLDSLDRKELDGIIDASRDLFGGLRGTPIMPSEPPQVECATSDGHVEVSDGSTPLECPTTT